MATLWTLLLIVSLSSSVASSDIVSGAEFKEIKKIADKILELCPPRDCVVVGVGRSPTPFMAALQESAPNYAYTIPISNFRYNPDLGNMAPLALEEKLAIKSFLPLSDVLERRLHDHISRFLPRSSLEGVRKILVVDYGHHGYSLFSFQKYLERYAHSENLPVRIGSLAIVKSEHLDRVTAMAPRYGVSHFQGIELESHGELNHLLLSQGYDAYAEYPSFDLNKPDAVLTNQRYLALKQEIHGYLHGNGIPGGSRGCIGPALEDLATRQLRHLLDK